MFYSFVMLKPDALDLELVEPIMQYLKKAGVEIERLGYRKVDETLLCRHYAQAIAELGDAFRKKLELYFLGKGVIPMVVRGESSHLIADIRRIVGATDPSKAAPGTIRGDLCDDSYEKCGRENRSCMNLIHASDAPETARAEIALWFGEAVAADCFQ